MDAAANGINSELVGTDAKAPIESVVATQGPQVVTFAGVLIHDNGEAVAWIEKPGKIVQQQLNLGAVAKSKDELTNLSVRVNDGGKSKQVRPGQIWLVDENTVKEAYQVRESSAKNTHADLNDLPDANAAPLN